MFPGSEAHRGLTRRGFLLGGALSALAVAGCTSAPLPKAVMTREPLPKGSVVGFYGDSLTAGFAASSPGARWSALLCARHGWVEINPSISGLGFVQARGSRDLPGEIIAAAPDLILVTLGINDLRLVDGRAADIRAAIDTDLHRLRDETGAIILVAMPFSPIRYRPPQLIALEGWLRTGAAEIDAPVIESEEWMADRPELTVDGIHFNDAGEARVAGLMDQAVETLVAELPQR